MLATLAADLPTGKSWSYEVKWDGYRTIAVKDGARAALYSRNHKDFTKTYASIAAAIARLGQKSVVLDGEVVAIDEDGRPSFQSLHHWHPRAAAARGARLSDAHTLTYYVFDVLHLDGRDLTREPLTVRREALAGLALAAPILRSDPLPGTPVQIEEAVRALGLEGLVAKRADSRYEAGRRSRAWIKVKFQLRQEFVVGGFTEDDRRVDALVVGYYDGRKLVSAAKVRAGLTPPLRRQLFDALKPLRQAKCPFTNLPEKGGGHWGEGITADEMKTITWLKPITVVQVAFTEWTRDHHLRHAAFLGVRDDVSARGVKREESQK
jgi:bifunctional non-homologous end joining protein LigD